jgi:hypothetical protein
MIRTPCVLFAAVLLGCGASTPGPNDSGTPDAGRDGGASDAGAPDGGRPDAGAPVYEGYVLFQSITSADGGFHAWSTGEVELFPSQPGGIDCPQGTVLGNCCLTLFAATIPPLALVSAGTLATSNAASGQAEQLYWDADSGTYDGVGGFLTWAPGDLLSLSASGAQVDAFSAQAVAPQPIAGLPEDAGALSISTSADCVLGWTPAGATQMTLTLNGLAGMVACRADDAAGQATIPQSLVAIVAADGGAGLIVWTRAGAGISDAGNARVELRVALSEASNVSFVP